MKIAHISDIHIRNLKFHLEYRRTFDDFEDKLVKHGVELAVNTGDTAHTKTNVSPEFYEMAHRLLTRVAKHCPIVSVLGNHDLNLMNADRQDAITPLIEALNDPWIELWKKSGKWVPPSIDDRTGVKRVESLAFYNFGIADVESWPQGPYPDTNPDGPQINIGLFHGSIQNCVTDSNFRMTHVEYGEDIFEGLDFVMMGDIHKRQWFNNKRIWYAGSMIQQNFGEDPDKGFLLWDIRSKNDWDVEFIELKGSRRFYTIKLPDDLRLPDVGIEPDSRVRISPPRQLTLVEQKTVEKLARKKYQPHDVITLGVNSVGQMTAQVQGQTHRVENLRDVSVQEGLLRSYLAQKKVKEALVERVLGMNRKYQVSVEQREEMARGVNWRVLKMGWNNLYNYGEGNVIDFNQIKGLTGIFAPNASGKSSMVDVITVGMFDANTKEVSKNIHLVNDNKDKAAIILELLANGERFGVQREIERIKYVRKGQEHEWGKTTLDFVRYDRDGGVEKLVQEGRPDTEKQIRRRFGSFDDFMLTSLFAQWDPMDIIMVKETERKRILFRFLDLDIFEEKAKLAKEESKVWLDRLADLEENGYDTAAKELEERIAETAAALEKAEKAVEVFASKVKEAEAEIEKLLEQRMDVKEEGDPAALCQEQANFLTKAKLKKVEFSKAANETFVREKDLLAKRENWKWFDLEKHVQQAEEYNSLKNVLFSLKASLKDHERHVADRKRQTSTLAKVPCGDQFPTCQFLVDAFRAKNELPEHEREVEEFKQKVAELEEKLVPLRQANEELDEYYEQSADWGEEEHRIEVKKLKNEALWKDIEALERQAENLQPKIDALAALQEQLSKNAEIDSELKIQRNLKLELEQTVKRRQQEVSDLNRKLGSDQGMLEKITAALAKLQETRDMCEAFEHYTDAMGKDGIALQVLRQKLPVINEEINKILQSAAEFGVFIEYDEDDQTIRLYIQYGQYKSRLLELGSGAEKFLASVAIRAALLSISNLPRSNMFIIDEGFGKLDPQNIEAIQRMFDYLKSVFDHVIVISHSDVMKDMVDNMIEITADDDGYAHVEIGG